MVEAVHKGDLITIQIQGNFHKKHTLCWHKECFFENFFGEKPT